LVGGTAVGLAVGVVFRFADEVDLARRIALSLRSTKTTVYLHLPPEVANLPGDFRLLYVRDGRDQIAKAGPYRMRTYRFAEESRGERKLLVAGFRHSKTLGAQFKCFVDTEDRNRMSAALTDAGFGDVTQDEDKVRRPDRLWFLLSEFGEAVTADGYRNNFASAPID
jgi:hypothetical protein